MKSKKYYIGKYRAQRDELKNTSELWRLCCEKEEDFISRLNEIIENYHEGYFLNEFHKENSTAACIEGLLQKRCTIEEMEAQMARHRKSTEEDFKKEIPAVLKAAKSLKMPLHINVLRRIYRWLFRNQITLDDLSIEVREEFMKTKKLYPHWLKVQETRERNAQSRNK